ncbi:MAG: histidine--tRNA ligase, partial [Bacteroidota bacterium]
KILNSGDYLSKTTDQDYKQGSKHFTSKVAEKGLRYDLTVPFARYVVMNQHEIAFPFKRFQIQPVWRADRPQKGRYREFYQCDADIIGSKSIWNEVELTLLFHDVFNDLGLQDYVIKINHREILFMLAEHAGLKEQAISFCAEIDKLDKIGEKKVIENIISLGADKVRVEDILRVFSITEKDQLIDQLKRLNPQNKGVQDIESFFQDLEKFNDRKIKIELDVSLARGLSYYTGMIYEVKPTSVQMGSICGGGRYDDLTGIFGLQGISGIGISFGLDRIYDVMEELKLFPSNITQPLDVLIVHFSKQNLAHGQKIVMDLRTEGIRADLYPEPDKIKKQFNYADKIQTPYTLIIGDNEMESEQYMLKNMQSGEQKPMKLDEIIQLFRG